MFPGTTFIQYHAVSVTDRQWPKIVPGTILPGLGLTPLQTDPPCAPRLQPHARGGFPSLFAKPPCGNGSLFPNTQHYPRTPLWYNPELNPPLIAAAR